MKRSYQNIIGLPLLALFLLLSSCKKFVELGAPPTQVLFEDAYKTDASAQAAVLGMYTFAGAATNGLLTHLHLYPGVASDELQYNGTDANVQEVAKNAMLNTNSYATSTWSNTYQLIKNANNAISGLTQSTTLTPATKSQLLGEAKFMRAFGYFHLVNLFGDVPLPLKDDYSAFENALLPRSPVANVYDQIVQDLLEAQAGLPPTYVGTFRGRINKHTATTLLARVYLYRKDYAKAEAQATLVIGSGTYSLPSPTANFTNSSNEIIWQIGNISGVSVQGGAYVTATTVVPNYSLADVTYASFESTADLRRSNWVTPKTIAGKTYYGISKYKLNSGTGGNEYNIVFRFAELYLIRAEARAMQNNVSGAKDDIDLVRLRAGLGGVSPSLLQDQMLAAIAQERTVELFGEWGHRWYDLKRTNKADAVLGALKPTTWQTTAQLYPIPQAQRLINTSLTQNLGYPQ